MKTNQVIKQVQTSSFPHAVKYTRLWLRWIDGRKVFTVATQNNVIQGNFDCLEKATELYNTITTESK